MKVLFLDVDGVLNSAEWFARQMPPVDMASCDPKAVKRVLRVLEQTGATLVLSSTWRHYPELLDKLKTVYGLPISDVTPDTGHRGDDIELWLFDHPGVVAFAVIDDDTDAATAGNFVRTHWKYGMYGKHERLLRELLSG